MTLAVAAVVAFVWLYQREGLPFLSDSFAYVETAEEMLSGTPILDAGYWLDRPLTVWPLGYPLMLAAVSRVLGIEPATSAAVLNGACLAVIPFATWSITRRALRSSAMRMVATVGVAVGWTTINTAFRPMTDLVMLTTMLLLVAVLVCWVPRRPAPVVLAAVGALCAVLGALKWSGPVFPVVAAIGIAVGPRPVRWARGRLALAALAAGSIVPLALLVRRLAIADSNGPRANLFHFRGDDVDDLGKLVAGWTANVPHEMLSRLGVLAFVAGVVAAGWVLVEGALVLVQRVRGDDAGDAHDAVAPAQRTVIAVAGAVFVAHLLMRGYVAYDFQPRNLATVVAVWVLAVCVIVERRLGGRERWLVPFAAVWGVTILLSSAAYTVSYLSMREPYTDARRVQVLRAAVTDQRFADEIARCGDVVSNDPFSFHVVGLDTDSVDRARLEGLQDGDCVVWWRARKHEWGPGDAFEDDPSIGEVRAVTDDVLWSGPVELRRVSRRP